MNAQKLASYIDHTLLAPAALDADILRICREALQVGFASVCVQPDRVPLAVEALQGRLPVACVVGFPQGASQKSVKAAEAALAAAQGAGELDMVLSIGDLVNGRFSLVGKDIASVVHAAQGVPVKVILECCMLTDEQKMTACRIAQQEGAAFVKTSTGFGGGGATLEDVRLMRRIVGPAMGVKASGGIRTLEQALAMLEAGANRIGTASGMAILAPLLENKKEI